MTYVNNKTDTLFADVSEFQAPVDDSYLNAGYRVLSIRSNDGTYRDHKFSHNYAWCARAVDDGRLDFFIVYAYWRPNWFDTVSTMRDMVAAAGGPHPKMVAMIDVESGGNPNFNHSNILNQTFQNLAGWLGDPKRVIGYANRADLASMWPDRPAGLRLIGAGYGQDPGLPGQIAHQYTDGNGYGGGLPEGVPPFGNCDMNSANGLSVGALAQAMGVGGASSSVPIPPAPASTPVPLPPRKSRFSELPLDDSIYAAASAIAAQFRA